MNKKYATDEERKTALRAQKARYQSKYRKTHKEKNVADNRKAREAKKRKSLDVPAGRSWEPDFVGVDGESFLTGDVIHDPESKRPDVEKQAYLLLYRQDLDAPLFPAFADEWKNGLRTVRCLDYLSKQKTGGRKGRALVGFFLNFDFEWLLKDVAESDYKRLQEGQTVDFADGFYRITWIPSKFLSIQRMYFRDYLAGRENADEPGEPPRYSMTRIMDTQGFFQTSFVKALNKWGLGHDSRVEAIERGKAGRGAFTWDRVREVIEYNRLEQELLEDLMLRVHAAFEDAYQRTGLSFDRIKAHSWSGPGVFSNDFLRQTLWHEEHPYVSENVAEQFWESLECPDENNRPYPFTMAYFGGRIECSTLGRVDRVVNNDIHSAYPYAMSLLPAWEAKDFIYCTPMDLRVLTVSRPMGMVHVLFDFPPGWTWYPFPVRVSHAGSPNVYYPPRGDTWIMTPEFFAFWDTATESERRCITLLDGLILSQTGGYGDALRRMPEARLSMTARYTLKMATIRLELKESGGSAERALKLMINALYGKTVQQVGAHKYFSDFASAWITSVCRSLLWRAMVSDKKTDRILMTMTDGLYARGPLDFCERRLSSKLGDFEQKEYSAMELFQPGVYRYQNDEGWSYRVRGFLAPTPEKREELFAEINQTLRQSDYVGSFPARNFISRAISLDGWSREPYRYQFVDEDKEIKSGLKAKRGTPSDWKLASGQASRLFYPKQGDVLNISEGYRLKFDVEEADVLPEADSEDAINAFMEKFDSLNDIEEYLNSFD